MRIRWEMGGARPDGLCKSGSGIGFILSLGVTHRRFEIGESHDMICIFNVSAQKVEWIH